MFTIKTIQIQPLCKYHSLVFTHICIGNYCTCSGKLCEKCVTEHENQNQNSKILKIDNYYSKIQTEIQILEKQQGNLKEYSKQAPKQIVKLYNEKFEKFALNQVNVLQDTMKYLNQELSNVNQQVKQASEVLSSKMKNIQIKRKGIPQTFARNLHQKKLVPQAVQFYSQKGFKNFRDKLDKILHFRGMIKDFLTYADKYGKQHQQFMKASSKTLSNQMSLKATINEILPKYRKKQQKANTGENFYELNKQKENSNSIKTQQSPRKKRAKTIFGKKY